MKLWLIRHGATQMTLEGRYSGHGDPPLAPAGRAGAQDLASLVPSDLQVWSSDLRRARETAELALLTVGRTTADLREMDFGAFEGRTPSECAAQDPEAYAAFTRRPWDAAPPGGEAFVDLKRRVDRALAKIRAEAEGDVAIVAHVGPIKVILLEVLGLPLSSVYAIHVAPASAALVELWDGGATLRALNLGADAR